MSSGRTAPVRTVGFNPLLVDLERRADGAILVTSSIPEPAYPARISEWLSHWARNAPDRLFLAERDGKGGWRQITYGAADAIVRALGQSLVARGLSAERPLMILSGNSIDHALLGLAAVHVGVPYAPISTAYSLISTDHAQLKHIAGLLTPGLVFAEDGAAYAKAIAAAVPPETEFVVSRNPPAGRKASDFAALAAATPTADVETAAAAVGPDTIAKFLFTSGSTAMPKGVINTNRMICANQGGTHYFMPFMAEQPPVLLDWLPWNHTFGGNNNYYTILRTGGTLYIDDGRPTPQGIAASVRNLRDIKPTLYYNVPKGFEAIVPYLRDDTALAKQFFGDLVLTCFAGAALSQHVWDAFDDVAVATCGERIFMLSGYGATETAPSIFWTTPETSFAANVGLPMPGITVKLVPNADKLELRLKGPNVTPGYWRQPELTQKAFDEEGFYCLGDALRFADPNDVSRGFFFDGRVTEDFKLATGTWVSVGPLRARFIQAFAPYVKDVVIAGHNEDDLSALVFPDFDACRDLAEGAEAPIAEVLAHPAVREKFRDLLTAFAKQATGSASRVMRIILVDDAPSIDQGEITDKGSINQRAVLRNRAALIDELYAKAPSERALAAA